MNKKPFSIRKRLESFRHAFRGIARVVKEEHNFRIHLVIAFLAIAAGFLLNISPAEWLIIILISGLVLVSEILNSAIEQVCDIIIPGEDPRIKNIKDIMAAAVLISSILAVIIGLIIFLPRILVFIL